MKRKNTDLMLAIESPGCLIVNRFSGSDDLAVRTVKDIFQGHVTINTKTIGNGTYTIRSKGS